MWAGGLPWTHSCPVLVGSDDELLGQPVQQPRAQGQVLKVVAEGKGNSINHHQPDLKAAEKIKSCHYHPIRNDNKQQEMFLSALECFVSSLGERNWQSWAWSLAEEKMEKIIIKQQNCSSVSSPQTAINSPSSLKFKSKSESEFRFSGGTAEITQLLSVICLGNTQFNRCLKIFQAHCTGAEDLSCLKMFALLNYFFCSNH